MKYFSLIYFLFLTKALSSFSQQIVSGCTSPLYLPKEIETAQDLADSFNNQPYKRSDGVEKIISYQQAGEKIKTGEEIYTKEGYLSAYRSFRKNGVVDREIVLLNPGRSIQENAYVIRVFNSLEISKPDTFMLQTVDASEQRKDLTLAQNSQLFEAIAKRFSKKDSINSCFFKHTNYPAITASKIKFCVFDKKISSLKSRSLEDHTLFSYIKRSSSTTGTDSLILYSFNKTKDACEINDLTKNYTGDGKFLYYYSFHKELIVKKADGSFYSESKWFDGAESATTPASTATTLVNARSMITTFKESGPVFITEYYYFN